MAHQYDMGLFDGSDPRIPEVVGGKRRSLCRRSKSLALRKEKPLLLRTAPLSGLLMLITQQASYIKGT